MDLEKKTGVELAGLITGTASGLAEIARMRSDEATARLARTIEQAGWEVLRRLDPAAHAEVMEWREKHPENGGQHDSAGTD